MARRRRHGLTVRAHLPLVAGLAAVLVGCGTSGPVDERGPVPVQSWSLQDGELHVAVPTCNGDPEVTVEETATTVSVAVVSTRRDPGDACLDGVVVPLAADLGDRTVLDGRTGAEVPRA